MILSARVCSGGQNKKDRTWQKRARTWILAHIVVLVRIVALAHMRAYWCANQFQCCGFRQFQAVPSTWDQDQAENQGWLLLVRLNGACDLGNET